jgi:hypothetical protein
VDQISAAAAVLCFGKGHGHRPGGGAIWAEGYRALLDRARAILPSGAILTTEENADPWLDQFDALLLVNTPTDQGRIVPLFPAAYAGWTMTFGSHYIAGNDLEAGLPFRLKMARAFCFGSQLGWVTPQVAQPKHRREGEYLRALARCRRSAHEFLAYGEFVGVPGVRGAETLTVTGRNIFGGTYRLRTPAVMATAWRAEDGALGIAMTNIADRQQRVEVSLPAVEYDLGGDAVRPREIGPEGTGVGEATIEACDPARVRRRMAPRSATVVVPTPRR